MKKAYRNSRPKCICRNCDSCDTGASLPDSDGRKNRYCSKCANKLCKKSYYLRKRRNIRKTEEHKSCFSLFKSQRRKKMGKPDNVMEYLSKMRTASNAFVEVVHTKNMGYGLFSREYISRGEVILSLTMPIYEDVSKKLLNLQQSSRYYMQSLSNSGSINLNTVYYSIWEALEDDKYCFSAQNTICYLSQASESTQTEQANVMWIASEGQLHEEGFIQVEVQTLKSIEKGKQIFAIY